MNATVAMTNGWSFTRRQAVRIAQRGGAGGRAREAGSASRSPLDACAASICILR